MKKQPASKIYAIVHRKTKEVLWSRSTPQKLLLYATKEAALAALNNKWILQVIPQDAVIVTKIYDAEIDPR